MGGGLGLGVKELCGFNPEVEGCGLGQWVFYFAGPRNPNLKVGYRRI